VPQIATQHLRNALAHRIEPAAQRHKSPRGVVRMAFERAGDVWDLVVQDDGAGIDFDAVRRCAVESVRRSAGEAAACHSASAAS
jgi:chemotaxis protein histidine kinase CheA